MTAETDLTRLSPLIERLVDEADARARERLLVDAIAEFDEAPAIAVWHESGSQWRATLERGEAQDLPSADEVEAIAAGSLSSLAADRHVLVAGRPASRIALALGGARLEEDLLDLLEALLVTTAELEAAADRLLDKLVAPFPSQVEASTEDRRWTHDLRNLLMSIRTTQDLLEMPGVTLDDDERLHFGEVLEHECQRAGDLLIDSLEGRRPGSRPPQLSAQRARARARRSQPRVQRARGSDSLLRRDTARRHSAGDDRRDALWHGIGQRPADRRRERGSRRASGPSRQALPAGLHRVQTRRQRPGPRARA